jgi:hypothetical protein
MPNESASEHVADGIAPEPERLRPSDERSDASARTGDARAPHTPADASDRIESFRDIHFTWSERGPAGESERSPGDDWWRSLEAEIAQTGEIESKKTIDGGMSLLDDPGDVVLSIEVPDTVALANEIHEEPPSGRPFREVRLTPGEANRSRDRLEIIDSNHGDEVQPDLRDWQNVPSQAPVPDVPQAEDGTADSPPSTRRSRRRLRRRSRRKGRRMEGNGEACSGTDDEAADSVNTVLPPGTDDEVADSVNTGLPQRFEDDPEGALNDLRAKVNELGYQLAYAGRTFRAPVTERTYHIVDREKRERIDAFGNGSVDLTLREVCLWSEQATSPAWASTNGGTP